MQEPLISVVVPVYNVSKFLRKNFDTLKNQTYKNIEIIFVDDGSTDNSGELCESYKNEDNRVKVIHKKNEGLGFARNTGIQNASGQYIMFIDSDDFVHIEMVEKLLKNLKFTNSDTSFCGYFEYYNDDNIIPKPALFDQKTFENKEVIYNVLLNMVASQLHEKKDSLLVMSVWHAIYSMDIIRKYNILFPSEREYISEDIIFDIEYLKNAKKVCYISEPLYFYRCNNAQSLTHKYSLDEFKKHKKVVKKIREEMSSFLKEEEYIYRADRYLLGRLRTCIQKAISYKKANNKFKLNKHIKDLINDTEIITILNRYPYNINPFEQRIFNYLIKIKFSIAIILLVKLNTYRKSKRF